MNHLISSPEMPSALTLASFFMPANKVISISSFAMAKELSYVALQIRRQNTCKCLGIVPSGREFASLAWGEMACLLLLCSLPVLSVSAIFLSGASGFDSRSSKTLRTVAAFSSSIVRVLSPLSPCNRSVLCRLHNRPVWLSSFVPLDSSEAIKDFSNSAKAATIVKKFLGWIFPATRFSDTYQLSSKLLISFMSQSDSIVSLASRSSLVTITCPISPDLSLSSKACRPGLSKGCSDPERAGSVVKSGPALSRWQRNNS